MDQGATARLNKLEAEPGGEAAGVEKAYVSHPDNGVAGTPRTWNTTRSGTVRLRVGVHAF